MSFGLYPYYLLHSQLNDDSCLRGTYVSLENLED